MIETRFKDTEIGKIPEEWEVTQISSLGKVITGSTPPRNNRDLWKGNFSWISAQDFKGKYIMDSTEKISEEGKSFCRILPVNSVLVTCIASIGLNAISKISCATNQQINAIICDQDNSPEFVYYQICNNNGKLLELAGQTAIPIINKGQFENVKIASPKSLSEQRRIATALSNVDALIAAVEKKIEKKKLIKQGAMQQLLTGKKRLPGFNGKWEIKQLGQIGKFTKGAGISRSESQSGKLPAIRYGEIYTDHNDYIREFKTFISDEVANRSRQIHYGDILFTASGETKEDIGKSVAFVNNYKAFAGGDIIIMSPKEEYDPIYMGYITNCRYVQEQKSSKGQGDAVVHIVTADISSVRIPFAPLSEQRAIASILSNMDSEITALERKRDKLKELKQGMMQQLLTGKIRLVRCSG